MSRENTNTTDKPICSQFQEKYETEEKRSFVSPWPYIAFIFFTIIWLIFSLIIAP